MDVKTAGHVSRQVPLPGNPRDGSSPFKRQSISPTSRGYSAGHYLGHPDAVRYPPNIHPPPPPPPASYGSSQLYRDSGLYQAAERLTVVESRESSGDHPHSSHQQYREQNEHSQPPPSNYPQSAAAQAQVAAAVAAAAAGRRRPQLLPQTDYTSAINRERERYLDNYQSAYYEHDLSTAVSAAGGMPAHAYSSIMVGHHGPSMDTSEHHLIVKRPRLTIMGNEQKQDAHRMLGIDTDIKREPAYNPQVEAISPTLPMEDYHQDSSPHRTSRDDLLQQIGKVDREIVKIENQIGKLKKKQQELEVAAAKPENDKNETLDAGAQEITKHLSLAQIVYAENRKKSQMANMMLSKLGHKVDLPLYNQPFDTTCYHENKKKYMVFKKRLMAYFKKRQIERQAREKYLTDTYNNLLLQWQKRVERIENNVKKKVKEQKIREFYEKQFPELKKQREDKERFSRVGTRIRSDAELEEIMDGLQEQELEDKKMRSYAVVPPILVDPRHRRLAFQNDNCVIEDVMAEFKEKQLINIWTPPEKEIFKEKYLQHPKNFSLIASYLERKSVAECVQYYYLTKKDENYKQLLRKHSVRKKRFNKPNQATSHPAPPQQTGVLTRASAAQPDDNAKSAAPITSGTSSSTSTTSSSASSSNTTTTSSSSNNGNAAGSSGSNEQNSIGTSTASGENPAAESSKSEQKEQNHDVCENSLKGDNKESEPEKETSKDEDTCDEHYDSVEATAEAQERSLGGPHTCAVCKTVVEHYGLSRPVSKSSCHQYGLKEEEVTADMRVCSFCHCSCPILSCRTPKRKVKRLRPLPSKWAELPPELKDPIVHDLQIPPEVTKCCSACFNRIARRMGSNATSSELTASSVSDGVENLRWTDEEIELAKRGLKEHGLNWYKVATVVSTKTEVQCKNFYFNYRRKLGLGAFVSDKYRGEQENEASDKMPPTVTDEEESGESTSSCEDFNEPYQDGSDTASAPSPSGKVFDEESKKSFKDPSSTPKKQMDDMSMVSANYIDDPVSLQESKDLSASRGSLKSVTDYDSSATVSADEGPSQLDGDSGVPMQVKGDPRHSSNGSREDSNSQSSAPSFLDESRVKVLLDQAAASRTDNQPSNMMYRSDVDNSIKGVVVVGGGGGGGGSVIERVEPESGEHIFTKTVRDLIDQAIDTSFPDGTSSNGPVNAIKLGTSGIPNIHDILKRSEKPAGMKSRTKEFTRDQIEMLNPAVQQQQPPQSTINAQMHHTEGARLSLSHMQQHHQQRPVHSSIQPHSSFIQQPASSGQQTLISQHHLPLPSSSSHPPLQPPHSSRIHHGYPHSSSSGSSSGQPVMIPRESLPTVNLYVPDDVEQVKAEDLSIKKDRNRDSQPEYNRSPSSSSFRSLPVQKPLVEITRHNVPPPSPNQPPPPPTQHMSHHGDRLLGAPPPAHSNQYHRSGEMSHLNDPRDTYYGIRQMEQRTKSPSTFPPDRVSQSQHIPSHTPQSQQCPRPMSPHVPAGYMQVGCSPPLKGQNIKGSNGQLVPAPPPLVSGSKHNTQSPKMTLKPDKLMSSSGSITQGTPVNQSNIISGGHSGMPSHPGGRYEEYIHHKDVGGSITLGTPVQHDAPASKRSSESSAPPMVANVINEQGPRGVLMVADSVKGPPHSYDPYYHRRVSPPAGYPYGNFPQYPRPPFATESQISSRQTIMADYYMSQQMQMRRNSGNEKEKEARLSPRMTRDCSPQSGSVLVDHRMHMYPYPSQPGLPPNAYIQHPDARLSQQQQRHLASPIDVHESSRSVSPSGGPPPPLWPRGSNHSPTMATPPPQQPQQQQRGVIRSTVSCSPSVIPKVKSGVGVIQSPKSSSPRSSDMEAYGPPKSTPSPRHPYTHGNEAFGNLIEVAIAQAIPKDVSKHHSNLPAHVSPSLTQGSIHDLRNMMPGMREDKINSTHRSSGNYYDERRGPQPPLPPSSQTLKERHKYESSPKMDPMNMDDRVRKFGPMLNAAEEGPSSLHSGIQPPFTRPDYGRMDADKMRLGHYKNHMSISGPPPPSSHTMPPLPSRDGHPIDVEDDRPPSHHHHRGSPHHQMPPVHRGSSAPMSSGFSGGDQRRPSPPQDLSSDSRRSTVEAYNSYTTRGNTSYKQYEGDPTKLLFDSLEKDQPKEPGTSGEKPQTLTAANLIDAIISHQINKVTTSPTLKRRPANSSEGAPSNKNFRISPDASNMNSDDRISPSPYKLQRATSYSGAVPKQKEELVVTLDDSPMTMDREQDISSHLASSSHSINNSNAGIRGTSPISSYVNSERPISRGRTPQPSSSPAAALATHSPALKLTLKEHIDAIISHDYQVDSAHGHYNRGGGDGRPPSGSGGSSQSFPPPTPPPSSSQSGRTHLGVHEVPERSSPNVQPSTRSASPDDHTAYPSWKLRKALQQNKEHQRELQQEQRKSPPDNVKSRTTPTSVSPLPPRSKGGLLAPDERQIIRIVQSASPRPSDMSTKGSAATVSPMMSHPPTSQQQTSSAMANYQVEPISPPSTFGSDSNLGEASSTTSLAPGPSSNPWITSPNITSLLTTRRMYPPPESADTTTPQSGIPRPHQQTSLSPFEKYVKHKIVEEMRKSSEETSGEASIDGRGGQQPRSSSPRVEERNNSWPIEKDHPSSGMKYRSSELNDPVTAGMFPGPASQYVPGAIYHSMIHHSMESVSTASSSSMGPTPSSSRSGDIPRPPFKRTFEVMEAVGSSERSGSAVASSSGNIRSRSISPSSSDVGGREFEDIKRKRYRLGDSTVGGSGSGNGGGHTTPESSTEWPHQMLIPESSESGGLSHRSGNAVPSNSHVAREPQLSSSSDHQAQVASGSLPSSSGSATGSGHRSGFSSSSSSSPDRPQSSRKDIDEEGEAQSTGNGISGSSRMGVGHHASSQSSSSFDSKPGSSMWGNEVSSGKDDKVVSQMADSPLSGEMVIDESAAIDSATSSKLEPVSPPPQEGISTSEQEESYALVTGRLSSSNSNHVSSDPGHSVTSSHGTETRSSPVGGPGSSGVASSVSASSTGGVSIGSSYSNPISSTVSNSSSFPNSSALVNNISGVSTTYTYPFSALSVRSLAAAVGNSTNPTSPSTVVSTPSSSSSQQTPQQPNQSLTSSTSRSNSPVSASREVPSLLMSSQYEPLSDED